MNKQTYRKARTTIRANGYFALRWLRMSEASVMLRLREQAPDLLSVRAMDKDAYGDRYYPIKYKGN